MTKQTIIKLFEHFTNLASDGGKTENVIKNALMKGDAQRHLAALVKKHPWVAEKKGKK